MYRCTKLVTLAAVGLGIALGWVGWDRLGSTRVAFIDRATAAEDKQVPSSEQAWQRLQAGNNRFAEGMMERPDLGASRRQELSKGQKPFAIVLTCADSRLAPEFIFNQGLGDLFVLRVAGNLTDPFILGSIEYAVEHLHVPLIVVLGHENCGAVAGALTKAHFPDNLTKLLKEVHVGDNLPMERSQALTLAIKNNVARQVQLMTERSDIMRKEAEHKKLTIIG